MLTKSMQLAQQPIIQTTMGMAPTTMQSVLVNSLVWSVTTWIVSIQTHRFLGAAEICDGQVNSCGNLLSTTETDDDGDGYIECAIDSSGWDGPSNVIEMGTAMIPMQQSTLGRHSFVMV